MENSGTNNHFGLWKTKPMVIQGANHKCLQKTNSNTNENVSRSFTKDGTDSSSVHGRDFLTQVFGRSNFPNTE